MKYPDLVAGDHGPGVLALQIGLRKALAPDARNNRKAHYGTDTIRDVLAFRIKHKLAPYNGRVCGNKVWLKLRPFLGPTAVKLLARDQRIREEEEAKSKEEATRNRIKAEWIWGVENSHKLDYRQRRPMAESLRSDDAEYRTDCSSFFTLGYRAAEAPDPNGFGYNGYGFTGTLWARGTFVRMEDVKVGDAVLYGHQSPGDIPSHVAGAIGGGQVASFGSEPGPVVLPMTYRPIRGIKRYPL